MKKLKNNAKRRRTSIPRRRKRPIQGRMNFLKPGNSPTPKKNTMKYFILFIPQAVSRNPKFAKYYCNRGVCFQKLMEWPSALKDFERCIELDPNYVKVNFTPIPLIGLRQKRGLPLYVEGVPQIGD